MPDLDPEAALSLYDAEVARTKELMEAKNHDYGEAWRDMRVSSLTDLILRLSTTGLLKENRDETQCWRKGNQFSEIIRAI